MRVSRSRKRGLLEHLRSAIANQQPFRCKVCQHRFLHVSHAVPTSRTAKHIRRRKVREFLLVLIVAILCTWVTLHLSDKPTHTDAQGSTAQ